MEKRGVHGGRGARSFAAALALTLGLCALLPANDAQAQLRNSDLAFRPPADQRVIGFHVYVSGNSMSYANYRDNINYLPAVDGSGAAHYMLMGIDQYDDVYVAMKSYDASGSESVFSNEIMLAGEPGPQCLVTGCNDNNSCTVDTCIATGCSFDPAPRRGMSCDDGNARTVNDVCQTNGSCAGTAVQCVVNSDCPASTNQCMGSQVCVANQCQAGAPKPDETTCNDG